MNIENGQDGRWLRDTLDREDGGWARLLRERWQPDEKCALHREEHAPGGLTHGFGDGPHVETDLGFVFRSP
jgi:hypothetical protein